MVDAFVGVDVGFRERIDFGFCGGDGRFSGLLEFGGGVGFRFRMLFMLGLFAVCFGFGMLRLMLHTVAIYFMLGLGVCFRLCMFCRDDALGFTVDRLTVQMLVSIFFHADLGLETEIGTCGGSWVDVVGHCLEAHIERTAVHAFDAIGIDSVAEILC